MDPALDAPLNSPAPWPARKRLGWIDLPHKTSKAGGQYLLKLAVGAFLQGAQSRVDDQIERLVLDSGLIQGGY
jgi:hypothetical protein